MTWSNTSDFVVQQGDAPNRAAVIVHALRRERRRAAAAWDAETVASAPDDDLDQLARYAVTTPMYDLG